MEGSEGVGQGIVQGGLEVTEIKVGKGGQVIFNQTPFYAESGGQVGDTGLLMRASDGAIVGEVRDTQKKAGDLFVHHVHIENCGIKVGDAVRLVASSDRRGVITRDSSRRTLRHA